MISHAGELEREIAVEQEALGENLAELEHQAKALLDWRAQVRKHPQAMLGAAFGGGLLVALMAGSRKSHRASRTGRRREQEAGDDDEPSAAEDAWEMLKGALMDAAAVQVTDYVVELLPDVREHLEAHRHEGTGRRQKARAGVNGHADDEAGAEP